jgi:hypothetical protein
MTLEDDPAYLLAKIRVTRTRPFPRSTRELADLKVATLRVGQTLTEVRDGYGARALTVSWPAASDLLGQEAHEPHFRLPTSSQLFVLAACIRWCWPDPSQSLYPGVPVAEAEILDSLQAFSSAAEGSSQRTRGAHRAALRRLTACGLLSRSTDGGLIRLGPVIALWPEDDVAALRAEHHRLPGPEAC